jgi:hypothetical protein
MREAKAIFIARDSKEARLFSKAEDLAFLVGDILDIRRSIEKYEDWPEAEYEGADKVFSRILEAINHRNIVLSDIID